MKLIMREALIILAAAGLALAQPVSHPYIGAGGCASSNCHGAAAPLAPTDSRILGNEYATWSVADKHSRAYKALEDPRGKRMGEILKLDATRDTRPRIPVIRRFHLGTTSASNGSGTNAHTDPQNNPLGDPGSRISP